MCTNWICSVDTLKHGKGIDAATGEEPAIELATIDEENDANTSTHCNTATSETQQASKKDQGLLFSPFVQEHLKRRGGSASMHTEFSAAHGFTSARHSFFWTQEK
jgi:hypothetical protein